MKRAIVAAQFSNTLGIVAFLASAACLAAETPTFSIKVLANVLGGTAAYSTGINNAGEVVGVVESTDCPFGCAVIWRDGVPTLLDDDGKNVSTAYSINNSGQVSGSIGTTDFNQQAVTWINATLTVLPAPGPQYDETFGFSLNDSGEVVGVSVGQVGTADSATVWHGSTPTVLGLPPGFTSSGAAGINSKGLVVGSVCCVGTVPEAVVWQGTTPTLLPRVSTGASVGGEAVAVNNSDLIVGYIYNDSGLQHAAAWANGAVTDLGTLATGTRSSATAVNAHGIIVGESDTVGAAEMHAALWSGTNAKPQDLNALLSGAAASEILLLEATGINESCKIVVNGANRKTGAENIYLLTLVDASNCVNGL
jgi:probable HAF family extracellular repeat protein